MKTIAIGWTPPKLSPSSLTVGDMPGDKVKINETHIAKANTAFPRILQELQQEGSGRLVISVFGGSGAGKSETGAVLAHYCREAGYPAYLMSGDNYPFRAPSMNDAERLNQYRAAGLRAVSQAGNFVDSWMDDIRAAWETDSDAIPDKAHAHEGFAIYQQAGRAALESYLGTLNEIDFPLINSIISRFKSGAVSIPLKRMGRTAADIRFDTVDFTDIRALIIEWTHGGNPLLVNVDLPVFLYSTPAETLAHRRARGRDKGTDSPFVSIVLDIEQKMLNGRAAEAAIIVGKDGQILSPGDVQ